MPGRPGRCVAVLLTALVLVLTGCAGRAVDAEPSSVEGPGGTGVVTAAPDVGADSVGEETACEVAAASSTLVALGMVGYSYDITMVADLSGCQLTIDNEENEYSSFGVAIVTAEDVALTANSDPTISNTSLVALPEIGENGHFIALVPGIDPSSNPENGTIRAASGTLGISLSWAQMEPRIPFETFARAAQELLDALP